MGRMAPGHALDSGARRHPIQQEMYDHKMTTLRFDWGSVQLNQLNDLLI